jgi:hypothetical protein
LISIKVNAGQGVNAANMACSRRLSSLPEGIDHVVRCLMNQLSRRVWGRAELSK